MRIILSWIFEHFAIQFKESEGQSCGDRTLDKVGTSSLEETTHAFFSHHGNCTVSEPFVDNISSESSSSFFKALEVNNNN